MGPPFSFHRVNSREADYRSPPLSADQSSTPRKQSHLHDYSTPIIDLTIHRRQIVSEVAKCWQKELVVFEHFWLDMDRILAVLNSAN